jgi:hypothetical protein
VRIGADRQSPPDSAEAPPPAAKAKPDQGQGEEAPSEDNEESRDPDLDNILR